jgi:8-amino-3,8-dideoxy-alpha-D-manno-octulosonate transaminase
VLAAGSIPVLAEVDDSLTLDPVDVEAKITSRTRAILPVHMRGGGSNMDALMSIAKRHGLVVIEDACQAAGATYNGRRLGTIGDAGAYSLQFNKIITTGEGGMFVCHDEEAYFTAIDVHDCAGSLRRAGELPRFAGYNFRASELTGAVGRIQLSRLDGILAQMRDSHARIAARVSQLPGLTLRRSNDPAGDAGIAVIAFAESSEHARAICSAITAAGVPAAPIYRSDTADLHVYAFWKPVLDAIAAVGAPAPDCPRTLELLERTIHLDVPPGLTDAQVELICDAVEAAVALASR